MIGNGGAPLCPVCEFWDDEKGECMIYPEQRCVWDEEEEEEA